MKYWACMTCGHLTEDNGFCNYCNSPLPSFLHSPSQEEINQGAMLGHVDNGSRFHLPLTFAGYGFYGITGSGKTALSRAMCVHAENEGIKLLVIDPEGEWAEILPMLKGRSEYYATLRNLKINPFDLHDKGVVRLLLKETIFRGIESEYWDLSPQMNFVLDACIDKSNSIPELIDNVAYYQSDELPFKLTNLEKTKTALLVRLAPYKNNEIIKEIFYCEKSSVDLNKLDDRNLIFDLHELESKVAYGTELRLVYNVLSVAALRQALSREIVDSIQNMLVADEAQLLVPKILKKILVIDTWATTEFATRLRKRGQSVTIISQSPCNIELDLVRNLQCNFFFRLQSPDDIKLVAGMLGYTHHQKIDHLGQKLSNLRPRQAIVKVSTIDEPFLVDAVNASMSNIDDKQLQKFAPKAEFDFSNPEQEFLESLTRHPFISMVERRSLLGWDERVYSQIVERLENKGIIKKVRVRIGSKGAPRVLYQTRNQVPGIKHEFYVNWLVANLASMGYTCRTSKDGPDIQLPDKRIAINVECGKSNVHGNIPKAFRNFDMVIVCSDSKKVIQNICNQNKQENILCAMIEEVPALFEKMRLNTGESSI